MADYVEGLVIEIEAESGDAVSKLDQLEKHLGTLRKAALNSTPLRDYGKNLGLLNDALKKSPIIDDSRITSMMKFSQAMSAISASKLNPSVANNIVKFTNAVNGIDGAAFAKMEELYGVLGGIRELSEIKFPSSISTGLKNAVKIAQEVQGIDLSNFDRLVNALTKLGSLAKVDTSGVKELANSVKQVSQVTTRATKTGRTYNTVLANLRVKTVALMAAWTKLSRFATSALGEYGDYIETLNLFEVSMDEAGGAMYEFAEKAQDLLGIDLSQWMKAQGVFMSLGKGFGIATDRAAVMSQQLTQLAYDISSFYNISVADAVQKVQSAFSGELEPVRRLGFDLSQARLQTIALSQGIDKNVASMTQAEKANLRYIALLTQVTDLQGDLARTIESPTNQLRILNAQFQQLQRSVGLVLLPLLNQVLPYLNAILRLIKMIADEVAALFGYTLPKLSGKDFGVSIADGGDAISDALDDANDSAEKLKNTLASFDEINLITSSSGGKGAGQAMVDMASQWNYDLPTYDFLGDAQENKAKEIADRWRKALDPLVYFIKENIKWVKDNFDEISAAILVIAGASVLGKFAKGIQDLLANVDLLKTKFAGFSMVTIGVTMSFIGGKDIGKGDIVKGFLESAFGTAVAGLGGYLMFGTTGLVIGLGISIVASAFGFLEGQDQALKQRINDVFFEFDDARQSVEDFEQTWNDFLSNYSVDEIAEKLDYASSLEGNVETIGRNIYTLQTNYEDGIGDMANYAANIDALWAELAESVAEHIKAIGDAIREGLQGDYGDFLRMNGVLVETVEAGVGQAEENIKAMVEDASQAVHAYREQLEAGEISQDEFNEAIKPYMENMSELYDIMGNATTATDEFVKSFDGVGINFEGFDQMLETVDTVSSSYKEKLDGMKKYWNEWGSDLEELIPYMTPEQQAEAKRALEFLPQYIQMQEDALTAGYKQVIERIENTAFVNWQKTLRTEDFEDANYVLGEGLLELDRKLSDFYESEGIERGKTNFKQLADSLYDYNDAMDKVTSGDYDEEMELLFYEQAEGAKEYAETISRIGQETSDVWDDIVGFYKDGKNDLFNIETQIASDLSDQMYRMTRMGKSIGDSMTEGTLVTYAAYKELSPKFISVIDGMAEGVTQSAPKFAQASNNVLRAMGKPFADPNNITQKELLNMLQRDSDAMVSAPQLALFANSSEKLVSEIGKAFSDPESTLQTTLLGTLTDAINVNPVLFQEKGVELKDNLLAGLTGSVGVDEATGSFKDMLFAGLDGNEAQEFGRQLGLGIADGMNDTSGSTKEAAQSLVKKMADPFNQFGSDLYDFMTSLTQGVADIWNGLTISTGKASFYNNGTRRWKMRGYASGGFPDSADFFYANENGVPEYIGSMGGKTAVANNAEIIEGVSDGVYRALKDTGLVGDVKKIANKSGKVVFAPSEEAGRVMQQSMDMYSETGGRY